MSAARSTGDSRGGGADRFVREPPVRGGSLREEPPREHVLVPPCNPEPVGEPPPKHVQPREGDPSAGRIVRGGQHSGPSRGRGGRASPARGQASPKAGHHVASR